MWHHSFGDLFLRIFFLFPAFKPADQFAHNFEPLNSISLDLTPVLS